MRIRALVVAALLVGSVALAADRVVTIELASGEAIEGSLVGMKDHAFSVRVGDAVREIPEAQVRRIVFRDEVAEVASDDGADSRRFEVNVEDAPLADVIDQIGRKVGRTVFLDARWVPDQKLTIALRKVTWREAVAAIASQTRGEVKAFGEASTALVYEPRVTMRPRDVDLRVALTLLGAYSGKNIVASPGLAGKVTFDADEEPWNTVLEKITRAEKLHVARRCGCLLVTRDPLPPDDAASSVAPRERSKRIDLSIEPDTDIRDICDEIGRKAGRNIIVEPDVNEKMGLAVRNAPWRDVVDFIALARGLEVELHGSILVLSGHPTVTLDSDGATEVGLLQAMAAAAGKNLVVAPGVGARVGLVHLDGVPWSAAIRVVALLNGLSVSEDRDLITVQVDEGARARVLPALADPAARLSAPAPAATDAPDVAALEKEAAGILDQLEKGGGLEAVDDFLAKPGAVEFLEKGLARWKDKPDRRELSVSVGLKVAMARGNALLSAMIAAKARFKLDEALAKLDAIKALAADLKKTKRPDHERAADALLLRGTELAREAATLRELRDAGIIVRATLEDGRPGEKNRAVIAAKDVTERVYEPLDDMKDVGIRGRNVTIVAIRFGAVTFRYKDMTFNRALGEE